MVRCVVSYNVMLNIKAIRRNPLREYVRIIGIYTKAQMNI